MECVTRIGRNVPSGNKAENTSSETLLGVEQNQQDFKLLKS